MDEITFVDMLFHYEGKLKESVEEIQSIKSQVNRIRIMIDSSWSGKAASVSGEKLHFILNELTKTEGALSEALLRLSAIGELLAEPIYTES